jgi:hypothetical protein
VPDFPICNSTVCSARRNCRVNWDGGLLKPDRDPKDQAWLLSKETQPPVSHDPTCAYYQPVDFELAWTQEREARRAIEEDHAEVVDRVNDLAASLRYSTSRPPKRFQELQASWYKPH